MNKNIDLVKIEANVKNRNAGNQNEYPISETTGDEVFTVYSVGLIPETLVINGGKCKLFINEEISIEALQEFIANESYIYKNYSNYQGYLIPNEIHELLKEENKDLRIYLENNPVVIPLMKRFSLKNEVYVKSVVELNYFVVNKNNGNFTIEGYTPYIVFQPSINEEKKNITYLIEQNRLIQSDKFIVSGKNGHGTALFVCLFKLGKDTYMSKYLEDKLFEHLKTNNLMEVVLSELKKIGVTKELENDIHSIRYVEDAMNNDFIKKGYQNFKVEITGRNMYVFSYTPAKYGNERVVDVPIKEIGYEIIVTYKNKKILGAGSNEGGWVVASLKDGTPKMVHSAWCQRANRWGKESGFVDQKYNHWDLVEWITSPYAEKIDLKIEEFPILYKGNTDYSKNARAALLKQLAHIPLNEE